MQNVPSCLLPLTLEPVAQKKLYDKPRVQPITAERVIISLLPRAEAGHADAQYMLGLMYEQGIGVPKDVSAAMTWLKKAAEAGFVPACKKLSGLGV